MTKEKLIEEIQKWEEDAGESFTDYFMHDSVADNSWAFWLLGKGFTERANIIIDQLLKKQICLDQSLLYDIHLADVCDLESAYPYGDYETKGWTEENYLKDVELWAEFLTATPYYLDKVTKFFEKYEE